MGKSGRHKRDKQGHIGKRGRQSHGGRGGGGGARAPQRHLVRLGGLPPSLPAFKLIAVPPPFQTSCALTNRHPCRHATADLGCAGL